MNSRRILRLPNERSYIKREDSDFETSDVSESEGISSKLNKNYDIKHHYLIHTNHVLLSIYLRVC